MFGSCRMSSFAVTHESAYMRETRSPLLTQAQTEITGKCFTPHACEVRGELILHCVFFCVCYHEQRMRPSRCFFLMLTSTPGSRLHAAFEELAAPAACSRWKERVHILSAGIDRLLPRERPSRADPRADPRAHMNIGRGDRVTLRSRMQSRRWRGCRSLFEFRHV